jgi:hypothetical protein
MKGCAMKFHLFLALILTGCAAQQPGTDASILAERKAYAACAVTKAFASIDALESAQEVSQAAVRECASYRSAIYEKLVTENDGKPAGESYAAFYMQELQATMVSHIAARLAQERVRKVSGEDALNGKKI